MTSSLARHAPLPLTILGILSIFAALPAAAFERELTNYNHLLELTSLNKIYAIPAKDRDLLVVQGSLQPRNKAIKAQDVVLTVLAGEERIRIPVHADGSFDLVPEERFIKSNPMVLTSMPVGEKSGFTFNARPLLGEGLRFQYSGLMASVQQVNHLIKENAGMMSFFMPKFVGIEFQFAKAGQSEIQILSKAGVKKLTADAKGVLRLHMDEALLAENPAIVLSERPQNLDFVTK